MYASFRPSRFKESTHTIGSKEPTKKMQRHGINKFTEPIPVYMDDVQTIAQFYCPSILARIMFLLTGKVWIQVMGKYPSMGMGIGRIFKYKIVKDDTKGSVPGKSGTSQAGKNNRRVARTAARVDRQR